MQSTRHKTWCKQLHVCKDPNREEEEEEIGLSDNDARYKAQDMWCKQLHVCKEPNREEEEEEIGLSDNNAKYKT